MIWELSHRQQVEPLIRAALSVQRHLTFSLRMGHAVMSSNSTPRASECRFLGMTPGEGDDSYAKNSQTQAALLTKIIPILFEGIKSMKLTGSDQVFRIADLGCSSGPNTISAVEAVIDQVRARYREAEAGDSGTEIQVYFQDLPATDFNTLIKLLFSQPRSDEDKVRNYMSAAVPGSFYDRLFPKSTINIAMSSFALHWISEVPAAVRDKGSPAYNGGHTNIHRSSLATHEAYAEQATKDLDNFLAARAHEIAPGGLLFLAVPIREKSGYPYRADSIIHLQEDIWNGLVLEGAVSEELRDDFNSPVYFRSWEEVNKILERYSSVFELQKREVFSQNYDIFPSKFPDLREAARARVKLNKGTSARSLELYFGEAATNLFYQRMEQATFELFSRTNTASADDQTDPLVESKMSLVEVELKWGLINRVGALYYW